jgi:hypothetical protein
VSICSLRRQSGGEGQKTVPPRLIVEILLCHSRMDRELQRKSAKGYELLRNPDPRQIRIAQQLIASATFYTKR